MIQDGKVVLRSFGALDNEFNGAKLGGAAQSLCRLAGLNGNIF